MSERTKTGVCKKISQFTLFWLTFFAVFAQFSRTITYMYGVMDSVRSEQVVKKDESIFLEIFNCNVN